MSRLFGTDGVRGLANREITAEMALDLSVAAAHVLADAGQLVGGAMGSARPLAVVGRDTRISGEFLEAAVVAGFASAGMDVLRLGVLPTPGIAFLTDSLGADIGVVLSASHNAMPDNGIKFFSRGGHKLPDDLEDAIEAAVEKPWERPVGGDVGRIDTFRMGMSRYIDHIVRATPNSLDGLKVVIDCAHGAASETSPEAMRRLGAEVVAIHAAPNGLNINDGCGSTHMEDLQHAVTEHGADLGIAHDGDADRCLAVDASGQVVDGDQIMAILAVAMKEQGVLARDTVVATVMSNLGFKLAMQDSGINLVETAVGDRYVLEAMREGGFNLGGEQSGHLVLTDHATTGDGGLTALRLMARMAETGKPLAELSNVMRRLPQKMINVKGVDKSRLATADQVTSAVATAEAFLGDQGRVLLRASGTEPLVRVMVEAQTQEQANAVAQRLADVVKQTLSL